MVIEMNIKELEHRTGITKQNIRFYERKGLLSPGRNKGNNYREYVEEDVKTLEVVKILRKLDMSIEDIHKILQKEVELDAAVKQHLDVLRAKQDELETCIHICRKLCDASLETLDTEKVLEQMEEEERKGGIFMSIVNDYKAVSREESMKEFNFVPNSMVMSPEEFSEALLEYAKEKDLKLVVTEPGMYPVFEIDGVEYTADRAFGRMGAVVRCRMTHPELAEEAGISPGKRKIYRMVNRYAIFAFIAAFIIVPRTGNWWSGILVCIMMMPWLIWNGILLWRSRN